MSVTSGQNLGRYRLVERIGEGGMGVVWKATDSTLGREVAIKILPDAFAADPERLARFDREARLLASLNHTSIAGIHGLESEGAVRFLVMELAEGETLAARLAREPLPIDETLRVALQIAEALEVAHDRGIVHRDLKPSNVMLSRDGRAKLLDFGLAKAFLDDGGHASATNLSLSPTITGAMTGANVILGTAAYMSPEQARGRAVDRRADIWAFGVVLFEMLTGRRLFDGETVSDTLASVLKTDPDWSNLPPATPPRVVALLRRCLDRDPRRRLRDMGEARITLEEVIAGVPHEPDAPGAPAAPARKVGPVAALALAAGVVAGALAGLAIGRSLHPAAPELPLRRFVLPTTENLIPRFPSISPDGRAAAYVAGDRLWVHRLDELEPKELARESGLEHCFWSPDGKSIGYLVGSRVGKVSATGGDRQTVSDTRETFTGGSGATWRSDGAIVFSHGGEDGLLEVSSLGGDPKSILLPDTTKEGDFHDPCALPGDRGLIFAAHRKEGIDNITLFAGGKRQELLRLEGQTLGSFCFSPTGHILFQRTPNNSGVWALPFSLDRLRVTGEPFLVVPSGGSPSVALDGTLLCRGGSDRLTAHLVWVNASGADIGAHYDAALEGFPFPSISPDGKSIAFNASESDNDDLWILDVERGTKTRLTSDDGQEYVPAWTPGGDRIIYQGGRKACNGPDCWSVLSRRSDGTGTPDTLATGWLSSISPDGRYVFFCVLSKESPGWDVHYVSTEAKSDPIPLLESKAMKFDVRVSPDGRYFTYTSDESGKNEVYLKRFPTGDGKWQVSVSGGMWSRWSGAGDKLFYSSGNDVMEVDVALGPTPALGPPKKLFSRPALPGPGLLDLDPDFDVTADGERFLILRSANTNTREPGALVVQNWYAEFRGKK